jgi:acetoin utilization protein AcuB
MTTEVQTIGPSETVEKAQQKMTHNRIRHLVVMEHGDVLGVVSERDVNRWNDSERRGLLVKDIMANQVIAAEPRTTVKEAANKMRGSTIGCLPVLDGGNVVGIVTVTDLLDLLGQGLVKIRPETEKRPVSREHPAKRSVTVNRRGH